MHTYDVLLIDLNYILTIACEMRCALCGGGDWSWGVDSMFFFNEKLHHPKCLHFDESIFGMFAPLLLLLLLLQLCHRYTASWGCWGSHAHIQLMRCRFRVHS